MLKVNVLPTATHLALLFLPYVNLLAVQNGCTSKTVCTIFWLSKRNYVIAQTPLNNWCTFDKLVNCLFLSVRWLWENWRFFHRRIIRQAKSPNTINIRRVVQTVPLPANLTTLVCNLPTIEYNLRLYSLIFHSGTWSNATNVFSSVIICFVLLAARDKCQMWV
jgi:hypothetical protein